MVQQWTRNMPWRQGHLLPPEALSLLENPRQHEYAVVISHDCDLANENLELEPHVEVLLGGVGNPDQSGNLRWGKSPRNIQLEFNNLEGTYLTDYEETQKVGKRLPEFAV
jgi:hypothetical protein